MLGIKDEIPKKFRIFPLPFLLKPPRALRMRFFRHGWGGGSVKTEGERGEIFKLKLKMGIGGGGGYNFKRMAQKGKKFTFIVSFLSRCRLQYHINLN